MTRAGYGKAVWPGGLGFAAGTALVQRLAELPPAPWLALLAVLGLAAILYQRIHRVHCRRRSARVDGVGRAMQPGRVPGLDCLDCPGQGRIDAAAGRRGARRFGALPRRLRPMRAWCGWVVLGFAWAGWHAQLGLADRLDPALEGVDLQLQGVVVSMPRLYGNSTGFELAVHRAWRDGRRIRAPGRVRLTRYRRFGGAERAAPLEDPDGIAAGAALALTVRLKRPFALANPDLFDGELRLLQDGIGALGYVRALRVRDGHELAVGERLRRWFAAPERLRAQIRVAMRAALEARGRRETGILIALAVGDQGAIGASDWALFNRTGVGHLMSISGLHVTMIAGLGMLLGGRLWRALACANRLGEQISLQRTRWLGAAAAATGYCLLAGWGVPAQRTLFMVIAAGIALLFGRGRSVLQVMSFAAGVVTLVDPWASLAAGFWLSFGAVGALLWSASASRPAAPPVRWRDRLRSTLAAAARTQAAVTIALVPLGAVFFGSTSLTGVLANAFAIPVITFVVTPLALVGAALAAPLPLLAQLPLWLGAGSVSLTLWALDALDALLPFPWVIPVPTVPLLLAALAGCAWTIAPPGTPARPLGLLLIAPLVFSAPVRPPAGALWLTALDVGQGSAVVVRSADLVVLFDAGPAYGGELDAGRRIIVPWLRARGLRTLDLMVVSHLDRDHSGGAQSVIDEHRVGRMLASLPAAHALMRPAFAARCRRGEQWQFGETTLELLHPPPRPETRHKSPTNAASCVLRISTAAASVLLTGDIEAAQERRLVQLYGDRLRSDLLVVPHHGSGTSSSAELIAAVRPRVAIVQAGYRNRFRHPQHAVLKRYESAGVQVLRTDRDGAIEAYAGPGNALRVERFRSRHRRYWRIDDGWHEAPPPATAATARSSPRRSTTQRRAPAPPQASTETRPDRRSARESRTPATAVSPTAVPAAPALR